MDGPIIEQRRCDSCGEPAVFTRGNEDLCEECAHLCGGMAYGESEVGLNLLGFAVSQLELNVSDDEIRQALELILADKERHSEGRYSGAGAEVIGLRPREERFWMKGLSPLVPQPMRWSTTSASRPSAQARGTRPTTRPTPKPLSS